MATNMGLLANIPGGYNTDIGWVFNSNNSMSCPQKLLPDSSDLSCRFIAFSSVDVPSHLEVKMGAT